MPDVTIIGAGPAGSASALLLARQNRSVTLIEQHRFPRDKVCGECLSALGAEVLDRLGLLENLTTAGAVWLRRAILHTADGDSVITPLPRAMLGISRHVLDAMLLDAARDAGAAVLQPARCEALDSAIDSATVRVRDLQLNTLAEITSHFAILADGKGALPDSPPPMTGDIGIKTHWVGVDGPRDAIELFGCRGCYGGLAAIERDRWNAAFSVPAGRLRDHKGNIDGLFAELFSENRSLARRLKNAERLISWLASPLPRFAVRANWPCRVIPIGNAAAAMEPIGGEGMGLALRSAELAVDSLSDAWQEWRPAHQKHLHREFNKLWRTRRAACRAAAIVVSSTNVADAAMDWAKSNEHLSALAMRVIGK